MNELEPKEGIEVDLIRHPEKKGETVPTQTPEGEAGAPGPLPKEGIMQTQEIAQKFAERVKDIPRAVVFGFVSNQPRTGEASFIFDQELRVMAERLGNSQVFNQSEKSLEEIAQEVKPETDKVVIMDSTEDTAMGMRDWNMDALLAKISELGSEPAVLQKWMGDPELQKELGITPEQIGQETKDWLKTQREKAKTLFPDRPIVITGIGHSFELDTAIASLMGKEFSDKTLDELGGDMINTMEGARIVIQPNGLGTVEYRDMKEELDLSEGREE